MREDESAYGVQTGPTTHISRPAARFTCAGITPPARRRASFPLRTHLNYAL